MKGSSFCVRGLFMNTKYLTDTPLGLILVFIIEENI